MKDKIIKVLQAHPKGLKAKEIASYIPHADRRIINQVLYTNKDCFQISSDYVWTLKAKKLTDKEKVDLANIVANAVRAALQETKTNNTPRTNSTKSSTVSSKRRSSFNYEQWYSNYRKEQEKKEKKAQKAREIISKINKEKTKNEILLSSKESTYSGDQLSVKRVTEWEKKQAEELLRQERIEKRREEKRQEEELIKSFHSGVYSSGDLRICTGDCSTCKQDICPLSNNTIMQIRVKTYYHSVPIYGEPNNKHRVGYAHTGKILSITEVRANQWGKLSTGEGWIDLSYTERII